MPENTLLKKLRLTPDSSLLLLNASPEWQTIFEKNLKVTTKIASQPETVLFFAPDKTTLAELVKKVKPAISDTTVVWVAFPKGSSKKQTDLTRDKGWESMPETEWQFLNLISLDETWSAFCFRLANGKAGKGRRALRTESSSELEVQNPYIDAVNRVVLVPEDLAQAFAENKQALMVFEKLAYSHRKEYILWVTSAKKEETRQKRVLETITKLDQGLKNPLEKPKA